MKFHPSLNVAYLLTELDGRLLRYTFKPATGTLEFVANYAILPNEAPYTQYKAQAAELQISADGKRLFASVRSVGGKIAMFAIDEAGGLHFEGALENLGRPRFFDFTPDQTQLYVCNQDGETSNVRVFSVDGKTFIEDKEVTRMDVLGAKTLVFATKIASNPVLVTMATTTASSGCPRCGKPNKSGKSSCCGKGGAWKGKCGNPGDPKFAHTWSEGIQTCKVTGEQCYQLRVLRN